MCTSQYSCRGWEAAIDAGVITRIDGHLKNSRYHGKSSLLQSTWYLDHFDYGGSSSQVLKRPWGKEEVILGILVNLQKDPQFKLWGMAHLHYVTQKCKNQKCYPMSHFSCAQWQTKSVTLPWHHFMSFSTVSFKKRPREFHFRYHLPRKAIRPLYQIICVKGCHRENKHFDPAEKLLQTKPSRDLTAKMS